jgi:hypothetical protein
MVSQSDRLRAIPSQNGEVMMAIHTGIVEESDAICALGLNPPDEHLIHCRKTNVHHLYGLTGPFPALKGDWSRATLTMVMGLPSSIKNDEFPNQANTCLKKGHSILLRKPL